MTTVALLAIVALVLVNGFFVAAEFALVSARPERMTGPETGVRRLVRRQMGSLDEYLAACQLGITIASLALGAIGEPTIANLIEPALGSRLAADAVAVIATIGALLIMTALHITIGEQAPKSFAIGSAERVVVLVAWPLEIFHRSLRPLVRLLNAISNAIVRAFGGRPATEHGGATLEELRHLIGGLTASGQVDPADARVLRAFFTLDERRASEVLTPRSRVIAVREQESVGDALEAAVTSGHSRLPMLSDDGELLGVVLARDLSQALLAGGASSPAADHVREMQITPERQTLDVLLGRLRDAHASICAVLDEYGVFLGIVTIEDILEEIVGEIEDESDRPTGVRLLPNGAVVCPGDTAIDDLADYGIVLESEAETVGGLVQLELGRVPRPRDTVTTATARLRVQSMDGNRVKRMHITPLDRTAPPR